MPSGPRINNSIRDVAPCKDCTERFTACSDRCPKDARGEFGYSAWKIEAERVKTARQNHIKKVLGDKYYDYGVICNGKK